jgi:ATP-dependent DNA helicase RecG
MSDKCPICPLIAILYVKGKGRIMNGEYQKINEISKRTATTDLTELVSQ